MFAGVSFAASCETAALDHVYIKVCQAQPQESRRAKCKHVQGRTLFRHGAPSCFIPCAEGCVYTWEAKTVSLQHTPAAGALTIRSPRQSDGCKLAIPGFAHIFQTPKALGWSCKRSNSQAGTRPGRLGCCWAKLGHPYIQDIQDLPCPELTAHGHKAPR